ncbi:MAG: hypothetical protein QXS19_08215 [Candidatus Methanomethylicia archaeon]
MHNESKVKPYSVSTLMMYEKPVYYGEDAGYYNFKINIVGSGIIRLTKMTQNLEKSGRLVINLIRKETSIP